MCIFVLLVDLCLVADHASASVAFTCWLTDASLLNMPLPLLCQLLRRSVSASGNAAASGGGAGAGAKGGYDTDDLLPRQVFASCHVCSAVAALQGCVTYASIADSVHGMLHFA